MKGLRKGKWGKTSVKFLQPFLKHVGKAAVTTEVEAYSNISQPPPKRPTLSFGGGSQLGVPCRGDLLGRVEQEGGKTSSDQYQKAREYLEGGILFQYFTILTENVDPVLRRWLILSINVITWFSPVLVANLIINELIGLFIQKYLVKQLINFLWADNNSRCVFLCMCLHYFGRLLLPFRKHQAYSTNVCNKFSSYRFENR